MGQALFYVPYQCTGRLVQPLRLEKELGATYTLLVRIIFDLLWVILLAAVACVKPGVMAGLLCLVQASIMGLATLLLRERWRWVWNDARHFFRFVRAGT